jgi:hypothetical protein
MALVQDKQKQQEAAAAAGKPNKLSAGELRIQKGEQQGDGGQAGVSMALAARPVSSARA